MRRDNPGMVIGYLGYSSRSMGRRRIGDAIAPSSQAIDPSNLNAIIGHDLFFPPNSNGIIYVYGSADPNAISLGGVSATGENTPEDTGLLVTNVTNDINGNPWFTAQDTLNYFGGNSVYVPASTASIPTATASAGGLPIAIPGASGSPLYSGGGASTSTATQPSNGGATAQPGTSTATTPASGAGGQGQGGGGIGWLATKSNLGPFTNGMGLLGLGIILAITAVVVDKATD